MTNLTLIYSLMDQKQILIKEEKFLASKIDELPKGSIQKQDNHYYHKYYENGKVVSKYLKDIDDDELASLTHFIQSRETLTKRLKEVKIAIKEFDKLIKKYGGNQNGGYFKS